MNHPTRNPFPGSKFQPVPVVDPWGEGTSELRRAPDGRALWVQRMLFGVRVQAGDEGGVYVDYCCGTSRVFLTIVYQVVLRCLDAGKRWDEFLGWSRRPIHSDAACVTGLVRLAFPWESERECEEYVKVILGIADAEMPE